MLYTIIMALVVIICILLTIVILLQPGQGQGLSGGIAGGMSGGAGLGARRTADILSKSTTVLGTALLTLCLLANFAIEREQAESAVQQQGIEQPVQPNNQSPSAVPLPQSQDTGTNPEGGN